MDRSVAELWAKTSPYLWPDDLVLVSVEPGRIAHVIDAVGPVLAGFSAIVVERDEISLTLPRSAWSRCSDGLDARSVAGPFRAITLDLTIDLGVCGYLLPAAERLAEAGISIVPQCAFGKDHLLVAAERADEAIEVLLALSEHARKSLRR